MILVLQKAEAGGLFELRTLRPAGQHSETPSVRKDVKISQMWRRTPVVPATRETEVGGSLGPVSWRLQ